VLFQDKILDSLTLSHRQNFKETAHGCCFVRMRNTPRRISRFIGMVFKRNGRMNFSQLLPESSADQVYCATVGDDA
jgi:hypothetical protein